jgi:hypothetical protein
MILLRKFRQRLVAIRRLFCLSAVLGESGVKGGGGGCRDRPVGLRPTKSACRRPGRDYFPFFSLLGKKFMLIATLSAGPLVDVGLLLARNADSSLIEEALSGSCGRCVHFGKFWGKLLTGQGKQKIIAFCATVPRPEFKVASSFL